MIPGVVIPTAQATEFWTPTAVDLPNVDAVAAHYWDSIEAPQRRWVVEAVALLGGAESLLELGCQSGPNLRVLRHVWHGMALHGIDLNRWALDAGRRWFAEAGIAGVTLHEGTVPAALAAWPDASVDVVLSVYSLAYVGPEDIVPTLREALRVAKRALVLIEPMATEQEPAEQLTVERSLYVEWRHDYLEALDQAAAETAPGDIRVAVIPKPAVDRFRGVLIATKPAARRPR